MIRRLALLLCLSAPPALAQPMSFANAFDGGRCDTCVWTAARGEITAATPDAFAAYLAQTEFPGDVVFDSPGGNLGAALRLGRMIREAGLGTGVARTVPIPETSFEQLAEGGTCESACAFAFLGGTARDALSFEGFQPRSGRVGFHQFYAPGIEVPSDDTQRIMGQLLLYTLDMGISAEVLSIASATDKDSMTYPDRDALIRLGLVTAARSTPMDLTIAGGGLGLTWTAFDASGAPDREMSIRCSSRAQGWLLRVRDFGAAPFSLGFDPANPTDMTFQIANEFLPVGRDAILALGSEGDDRFIEVFLSAELRAAPEEYFRFTTNYTDNFETVLSAEGVLPGAETLDAMARACGA